jgi:hypothetical protein
MSAVRNGLLVLLLIAAAVPLAGFAGGENSPFSEHAHASVLSGVITELKKKDDEAEVTEIRQYGPRSETHEQEPGASDAEQSPSQEQEAGAEQDASAEQDSSQERAEP